MKLINCIQKAKSKLKQFSQAFVKSLCEFIETGL